MQTLSAHDIMCRLRDRLEPEGWVIVPEVTIKDGNRDRRADAIAVNLWLSRGYEIVGYEFKSSRQDFLREMRDSSKSDATFRWCDKWFIVLGDKSIASLDEIPDAWGIMVPRGKSLAIVKQAKKLNPISVNRQFMAALLRRTKEWMRPDEQTRILVNKAVDEERNFLNKRWEQKIHAIESDAADAKIAIDQFYVSTGIRISKFNIGHIASEYLRGKKAISMKSQLAQAAKLMHSCAAEAEEAAKQFEEASRCAKELIVNEEMIHGMGI